LQSKPHIRDQVIRGQVIRSQVIRRKVIRRKATSCRFEPIVAVPHCTLGFPSLNIDSTAPDAIVSGQVAIVNREYMPPRG
jgi:hypothetical protein